MRAKYKPPSSINPRKTYEPQASLGQALACLALILAERSLRSRKREVRPQNESAIEAACLETAVRLGNLIERDSLGNAWTGGAGENTLGHHSKVERPDCEGRSFAYVIEIRRRCVRVRVGCPFI